MALKLNLGCGHRKMPGYVNVDKFGDPDVRHDLEVVPWPWPDSSVEEVQLIHVLEHLGQDPDDFIAIMKELYRVCVPGALIRIHVPHPRHDHFIGDPTHVRIITPQVLALFSRRNCERWQAENVSNTPLALYHGVDFETEETRIVLDSKYQEPLARGEITTAQVQAMLQERYNVAVEIQLRLRVVK